MGEHELELILKAFGYECNMEELKEVINNEPLNSKKKCIAFSRVSTLGQDVEQQTQEVLREAHRNGFTDDQIILIEHKESAVKLDIDERLGIQELKQAIENNDVECVIIFEISRLSRRPNVLFTVRDYLIDHGVNLICMKPFMKLLDKDGKMNQTAALIFSIFGSMAETEGYIRKERMRRGVEKAKAMGRHAGGQITFGYSVDKQHLYHIDPKEGKIVKWVFDKYVSGWSMRKIARELMEQGIFKCTYLTAVQNINNMIHNDIYIGNKIGRDQIISKETFEKAQNICRDKYITEREDTKRICKGILYDRNNGYLLSVNKPNGVYFSKRARGVAVSFKIIEPIIWEYAVNKYKSMYATSVQERCKRLLEDIILLNTKIENGNELIDEKKRQLDRLEERIILGKVNDKLADKLEHQLNGEMHELSNKIIKWKEEEQQKQIELRKMNENMTGVVQADGSTYYEREYNVRDFDEDMDIDEQIALVRQVIDKVILDRPARYLLNIEIHFNDRSKYKLQIDTFRHIRTDKKS